LDGAIAPIARNHRVERRRYAPGRPVDDQILPVGPRLDGGDGAVVIDGRIVGDDAVSLPRFTAGLEHAIHGDEGHLDRDLDTGIDVKPCAVANEVNAVCSDMFIVSDDVHLDPVGGERRRGDEHQQQNCRKTGCDQFGTLNCLESAKAWP
jgi:hypothetical protein